MSSLRLLRGAAIRAADLGTLRIGHPGRRGSTATSVAEAAIQAALPWPTSVGWCEPGPPGLAHIIPSLPLRAS